LKVVSTNFEVDDARSIGNLHYRLFVNGECDQQKQRKPPVLPWRRPQKGSREDELLNAAVQDLYTRLVKKRACGGVWRGLLKKAEIAGERAKRESLLVGRRA